MSDALGRPIMLPSPVAPGQYVMNGSPILINTWMPDCVAGATPIAFGNWPATYTIVNRRGITMQLDPYSAGWCLLYKWSARIGGGVTCPNASRLLRIK